MPGRKVGLTLERHKEIGLELARIRDRLTEIGCEIANSYPKDSKQARTAMAATRPLDQLRSILDSQMLGEHGGDIRATTHVYYPSREDRRAATGRSPGPTHVPFHDADLWCCTTHAQIAGWS